MGAVLAVLNRNSNVFNKEMGTKVYVVGLHLQYCHVTSRLPCFLNSLFDYNSKKNSKSYNLLWCFPLIIWEFSFNH
jgi:hypothetical protein